MKETEVHLSVVLSRQQAALLDEALSTMGTAHALRALHVEGSGGDASYCNECTTRFSELSALIAEGAVHKEVEVA